MDSTNLFWSARLRNAHWLCQTSHRSEVFVYVEFCFSWFFFVGFGLFFVFFGCWLGGCFCACFVGLVWLFLNTFSTFLNSFPFVSYLPPLIRNQLISTRECAISYSAWSVDSDPFPKSKFHSSSTQKMVALESTLDQILAALQNLWDKSDSNSDFKVHFHYLSKTYN